MEAARTALEQMNLDRLIIIPDCEPPHKDLAEEAATPQQRLEMAALMADGLGTTLAGFGGGSGTTTYGENIGVMAATKVYSTAAYWCAAAFALILSLCPKFGAVINTIPAGVLGGVTTLLYGMIGMIGIRIWVENKVNFDKPLNIMVAAITMIIAIGQFAFTVGGISFNGIAIGTIVILVAYHGLKAIGKATGTIAKDDPDIL